MRSVVRCHCSRCNLYLRSSPESDDQDYSALVASRNLCFEERKYQTALIEYAKNHNIIACLPTGSGKTFIALKLVEHFKESIVAENKKVIFLANTIPLVNQQAAFIARHSNLAVRHLTGDMEVDYWTQDKWEAVFGAFNVMAMTSQIFLNLLIHGYIKLSQIVLLIFDECHHAIGDHPMNKIMKEYMRAKTMHPEYILPAVMGLTATIIKGNCNPSEVSSKVTELEETMQSVAMTYKDYEEVLKHSTKAVVFPIVVGTISEWWYDNLVETDMASLSSELQKFRKERKKAKLGLAKLSTSCLDPQLRTMDNVYNLQLKQPGPGDLKTCIDDVRHAYNELGIYCALIAISLRLAFIEYSLMDINDGKVKSWYIRVQEYLQNLKTRLLDKMNAVSKNAQVQTFISPKLQQLINILERYREYEELEVSECPSADNRLCGLVFVDRRATAQVLSWYLQDLAEQSKYKHGFIRASFVVGTSRSAFESMESRVYAKKQTETLNGFRSKKYNLLTATSVLEEGIDVPSCNLVVRFDPIGTYTSYIQSMGRARKQGASFYALMLKDNEIKERASLSTFQEINQRIIAHLHRNVQKIDEGDHTINEIFEKDLIAPICPGGNVDSPKITMDSAFEVVDRYAMLLPTCGISSLQTLSWWIEQNGQFRATLKLPLNSLIRDNIVGPLMRNKELAKQGAYMMAAQKLLDAGAFDEKLIPVHPTFPIKVQKFLTALVPSLNDGDGLEDGEIDSKSKENVSNAAENINQNEAREFQLYKKEWFRKREPKILHEVPLQPSKEYFVYRIVLDLVNERETNQWKKLYQFQKFTDGFGIVCSQKLPNVGQFPLYGGFGTLHCSLKKLPSDTLRINKDTILNLSNLQVTLFGEILGLENALLQNEEKPAYFIFPLYQDKGNGKWIFNDKAEEQLQPLHSIQKTRPPRKANPSRDRRERQRNRSISPPPRKLSQREKEDKLKRIKHRFTGAIVFPHYKKPKPDTMALQETLEDKPVQAKVPGFIKLVLGETPARKFEAYLVDSVVEDMTPMTKFHDGNYKNFKEFLFKVHRTSIDDNEQPMLKCKLAGMAITRAEKSPIQLNYLLEKYAKEDEFPVYLCPELCYIAPVSSSFIIQLKMLPSFLHRLSRLLLAHEELSNLAHQVNWSGALKATSDVPFDVNKKELELLAQAQEYKREQEKVRRKQRKEMRDSKLHPKKIKLSEKPLIEQRELHYEFIHPQKITTKDIKLFHEAVSNHHSANKLLTTYSSEVEIVDAALSLTSRFVLTDFADLDLDPIDKTIDFSKDFGPSPLSIMEALSFKLSNDGVPYGKLQLIGNSFLNFAVSSFIYFNYPLWGEPLMCQLRNRLLSIQILHAVAAEKGIGELLGGSDFHPNDTWLPPGSARSFKWHPRGSSTLVDLTEVAAGCKVHMNIFLGLIKTNKLEGMSVKAVERFAEENRPKQLNSFEAQVELAQAPPGKQRRKPKTPFTIRNATFTHCELADFDVVNGLNALVGAFFENCGPEGAYKCLEWLGFRAPDIEGEESLVNDFARASPKDVEQNNANKNSIESIGHLVSGMETLETKIGYSFRDKNLLLAAFTHPTYPAHNLRECYQRLEFLGDAVLDLLLTNYVYSLPTKEYTPIELADIRYALVNSVTYASLAVRYGFHKNLLSMSKPLTGMIDNFVVHQESVEHHVVGHFTLISDEECWGPKHIEVPKVLADLWESVAGAIFIDSGRSLDAVWKVYYRLMQHEIDLFCVDKPKAPIHELKALMQKKNDEVIFTRNTGKKTLARGREIVKISIGPYGHYFGVGTNKARAKNAASKIALKMLKEEDTFEGDMNESDTLMLLTI